jgi:hypothetical protein
MPRPIYRGYRTIDGAQEEIFHTSSRPLAETIIRLCRTQFPQRAYTLLETWADTTVELMKQTAA